MKSKAHMKKCLELGVSMTSVEDTETEEAGVWLTELISLFGGLYSPVTACHFLKYSAGNEMAHWIAWKLLMRNKDISSVTVLEVGRPY